VKFITQQWHHFSTQIQRMKEGGDGDEDGDVDDVIREVCCVRAELHSMYFMIEASTF
jgi:hypothetical protein